MLALKEREKKKKRRKCYNIRVIQNNKVFKVELKIIKSLLKRCHYSFGH